MNIVISPLLGITEINDKRKKKMSISDSYSKSKKRKLSRPVEKSLACLVQKVLAVLMGTSAHEFQEWQVVLVFWRARWFGSWWQHRLHSAVARCFTCVPKVLPVSSE